MGFTLTQVRNLIYSQTGTDSGDFASGDTDVNLCANRAYWYMMDEYNFSEKEKETTFVTVAGTRNYNIATKIAPTLFEALQNVAIQDLDDNSLKPLDNMGLDFYMQNYDTDTDSQAKPTNWIHRGTDLILHPIPDDIYTIYLNYKKILDDITAAIEIPQGWHDGIEMGGTAYAFYMLGDTNRGYFWEKKFKDFVERKATTNAREKHEANPRAALSVPEEYLDY